MENERYCLYELAGDWYLIPLDRRPEIEVLDLEIEISPGPVVAPNWAMPVRDPHAIIFSNPEEF